MSSGQATDTAANFALMIETACRDFEALLLLIRRIAWIDSNDEWAAFSVHSAVNMSLSKSFVFHVIRAARICEHGSAEIGIIREDRKEFLKVAESLALVRKVNEHGFDRHRKGGSDPIRPMIHLHEDLEVAVDETSLTAPDEHHIMMGPANLREVYDKVKPFQVRYGFSSLKKDG